MKCKKCKYKINDGIKICPNCGYDLKIGQKARAWGMLGFFFPLVGLILYLVWNKKINREKDRKFLGIGSLIGGAIDIALLLFWLTLIIVAIVTGVK